MNLLSFGDNTAVKLIIAYFNNIPLLPIINCKIHANYQNIELSGFYCEVTTISVAVNATYVVLTATLIVVTSSQAKKKQDTITRVLLITQPRILNLHRL